MITRMHGLVWKGSNEMYLHLLDTDELDAFLCLAKELLSIDDEFCEIERNALQVILSQFNRTEEDIQVGVDQAIMNLADRQSRLISLIELVERRGFTAINPSRAVRLSCDKRETARFLAEHGIPHPRLFGPDEVRTLQWPVVAKPRFGSRGTGVRLVSGPEEIPAPDTPDCEYLLQEYIEPSHGRDFRVFFAFDRILAAVERRAGNSRSGERDLVSNTCTGGSMHPSPFSPPVPDTVAALTAEIARQTGLEYGTIDFLYATPVPDPSRLRVCELNAFPGFTALEKEGGFDIAGPLIDALAGLFFSE